jgi:LPS-assembly lipoprotein
MRTIIILRFVSIIIGFILLGGCGFHLRGMSPSNATTLTSIHLNSAEAYDDLTRELRAMLIHDHIQIVDNAPLTLTIIENKFEKRRLTITRTSRVDEYQLNGKLVFTVTNTHGIAILPEQSIFAERVFLFDRDKIIGKEYEEETLTKEMRHDMINQLLTRLYSITPSQLQQTTATP